ncbi:spore germination protein GerPC [Halobacillus yeomjeoni]|uniref:spore germination protein GerPC n=1 Tax=Halobacillus yeomjeoni TaxID=311194 RepID=UPI001CD34FA9|nr:spore germination protein GerPC [Halobacillus yeomjeoni]MCA0983852.1 spore germination protein GerPC [Halobacillus yeomjeoni]
MNSYNPWNEWMQQMFRQVEQQQRLIEELQNKIEHLQANVQPKTVIEKIEYHFDQLKIETLEGTLQIGLTPNGSDLSDVGDLYTQKTNTEDPILHTLHTFMTEDIPHWMAQYIRDHDLNVSEQHQQQIVADVQKQLSQRVEYYKNQDTKMDAMAVVHQIQTEIRSSIAQYLDTFQGDDFE